MSSLPRISAESVARTKQMKRLREEGWTLQRIADLFEVSRQRVQQLLGNTGWVSKKKQK